MIGCLASQGYLLISQPSSASLDFVIVKIFAYLVVGGWSRLVWSFIFDLSAMGNPTGVGNPDDFDLRITGTSNPSAMLRNDHIYLDVGVKGSPSNAPLSFIISLRAIIGKNR